MFSSPHSDAFQKREKASEDWAIRQREKEKLLELKKKLSEQQAHLKQLEAHMYVEFLSSSAILFWLQSVSVGVCTEC